MNNQPQRKHVKSALVAFVAVSVLFAVLLAWRSQPVKLRMGVFTGSGWDVPSPQSYKVIDQAIETFESQNHGYEVEYVSGIMPEDYSTWLSNQIVSGEAPDIFMILPEDFDLFCETGALENLNFDFTTDGISKDELYSSALKAGEYQSELYALPFESNVNLLFINTNLLEKENISLPDNLDLQTFYEICRQVTKDTNGDGRNDQFGICNYSWKEAADAYGVELFNPDGTRISLSDDSFLEAFSYASDLNQLCRDADPLVDTFSEGNAAFAVMSFADYRTYAPYPWKIKRLSTFDWDVMPLPAGETGISEVETIQMAISSSSSHKKESWKLLKTLCLNPDIQALHYTYSQGVSALRTTPKTVSEDSEVDYTILDQVLTSPVRKARFSSYFTLLDQVDNEIQAIMESGQNQNILLMQAEEKINRILNQP